MAISLQQENIESIMYHFIDSAFFIDAGEGNYQKTHI